MRLSCSDNRRDARMTDDERSLLFDFHIDCSVLAFDFHRECSVPNGTFSPALHFCPDKIIIFNWLFQFFLHLYASLHLLIQIYVDTMGSRPPLILVDLYRVGKVNRPNFCTFFMMAAPSWMGELLHELIMNFGP